MRPPYLSPSQVSMFIKCGKQYEYRYIQGIKSPPSGAMIRGRSLDDASNLHYTKKASFGEGLSMSEFVDQAVSTYTEQIMQVEVLDMPIGAGKDGLVTASRAYHQDIAQHITPRSRDDIQKKVEGKIGGVDVMGIIDLILVTSGAKTPWITDTKLKGKVPSQEEVSRSLQLTTYAMLENVPLTSLLVANTKGQTNIVKGDPKTPVDYRRAEAMYQTSFVNIEKGVAIPASPMAWWCSQKWCGYWDICPFGAAGSTGVRDASNVFMAPKTPPTEVPVVEEDPEAI